MAGNDIRSLGECLKHWRLTKGQTLETISLKTRIPLPYLRALEANEISALPPIETVHHTLGESLRECREQAGLSLEYIAKRTRVPLSYLQALEDNNSLNLPSAPVIARAYVNAYLGCLSLQDRQKEEVLIQFAKLVDTVYAQSDQQPVSSPTDFGTWLHRTFILPISASWGAIQGNLLALYVEGIQWRALVCRRTVSAVETARLCARHTLHSATAVATVAGQAALRAVRAYAERVLSAGRLARQRPAVWYHALTAGEWQIRHSFIVMHRDGASHPDGQGAAGHAGDFGRSASDDTSLDGHQLPDNMGVKMWVWMVQYGITILLLLLLGSVAGNIPLFKETALGETKLDASHLVEFLGYGGALFMVWLAGRKASAQLDRDRSGFAFLRPLVVPLTALIVISASYKVLLVLVTPFLTKADRQAYNWVYVVLIVASTLWVILAWFLKSAPMLESLEMAGRDKRSMGDVSSHACPQCRTAVPQEMKFCGHCGVPVAMTSE